LGGTEFSYRISTRIKKILRIERERKQKLKLYLDQEYLTESLEAMQSFWDDIAPNYNLKKIGKLLMHFPSFSAMDIFIPAGRSFFSLLQKNIFRFLRADQ
jgi:hypothetical protein